MQLSLFRLILFNFYRKTHIVINLSSNQNIKQFYCKFQSKYFVIQEIHETSTDQSKTTLLIDSSTFIILQKVCHYLANLYQYALPSPPIKKNQVNCILIGMSATIVADSHMPHSNISLQTTQLISADYFLTIVKLLTRSLSLPMKISNGYFAIPKQLYHTSYTPLEFSRASSLQPTPTFTHPLHPATRPEGNAPVIIVRDIARNNLSSSQASQQELKSKLVPHEYYSKSTSIEELVAQLQIKMEELGKKVNKNTEDIKNLRQKDKSSNFETNIQKKFAENLEKIQQKQATFNEDCLLKIVKVKEELFEISAKASNHQNECVQRLGLKIDEKMLIKVRNLIEERVKQQTAKIRLIIQNETNKLVHDLRWEIKKEHSSIPVKSKLKYPFKAIKLTYNEFMDVALVNNAKGRMSTRESSESPRSGRYIFSEEKAYFIDKDGYLLDEDSYYMLDQFDNMIRLDQGMLVQLRKQGILKQ